MMSTTAFESFGLTSIREEEPLKRELYAPCSPCSPVLEEDPLQAALEAINTLAQDEEFNDVRGKSESGDRTVPIVQRIDTDDVRRSLERHIPVVVQQQQQQPADESPHGRASLERLRKSPSPRRSSAERLMSSEERLRRSEERLRLGEEEKQHEESSGLGQRVRPIPMARSSRKSVEDSPRDEVQFPSPSSGDYVTKETSPALEPKSGSSPILPRRLPSSFRSSFDEAPIATKLSPPIASKRYTIPDVGAALQMDEPEEAPIQASSFDDTPIGGGSKASNPFDDLPLSSRAGAKSSFDETPIGNAQKGPGSAFDETPIGGGAGSGERRLSTNPMNQVLEASASASAPTELLPCGTCGRTFQKASLERHLKICAKVSTTKRKVFSVAGQRLEGSPSVPKSSTPKRKGSVRIKPEDEFKKCPHCERKFGPKPYDRHVKWCEEKSMRMQDSPKKDLVALAKLHARTAYKPKTPGKRDREHSPSRRTSVSSSFPSESPLPYFNDERSSSLSRSESRNSRRSVERKPSNCGQGISYINTKEHTKETPQTHFIRAMTGRGSIKRGPAPTRASQLRELAKKSTSTPTNELACPSHGNPAMTQSTPSLRRAKTPNLPRRVTSPVSLRHRKVTSPGTALHSQGRGAASAYSFQPVVKPSVVRPYQASSAPSHSYRREPEGIEHDAKDPLLASVGSYDHSAEYDPYQSAAKQMQELLFGAPSSAGDAGDLQQSSNSAFEKYVPSTSDINTKMNAKTSLVAGDAAGPYVMPRRAEGLKASSSGPAWDAAGLGLQVAAPKATHVNFNPVVSSSGIKAQQQSNGYSSSTSSVGRAKSPKVARFCHECGNPFALPNIRFCCECGVKRLYM